VDWIVLSGGGALIPFLPEFIQSKLNVPIEVANPLRNIEYDPDIFKNVQPDRIAPLLAVAVGLATSDIITLQVVEIVSGIVQAYVSVLGVEAIIGVYTVPPSEAYSNFTLEQLPAVVQVISSEPSTVQTSPPLGASTVNPGMIVKSALEVSATVGSEASDTFTRQVVYTASGIVQE